MKPRIMDKIRILRSSRKKNSRGKPKASSQGVAPVPIPQPVLTEVSQQWVPVLVLDISKAENTAFPVNSSITNTLAATQCQVVESSVTTRSKPSELKRSASVKTSSSAIIPVTSSISLTCNTHSIPSSQKDLPDNVQDKEMNSVSESETPLVAAESSTYEITSLKDETDEAKDGTSGENPVKCVLCDKSFPSLKEMQVHYLSTHKSRKGREGRKRSVEHTDTLPSSSTSLHLSGMGWEEDIKDISDSSSGEPVCPVCRIAFKNADEVKEHVKHVHAYVCSECNSTFYTLFQFTDHKCNKGNKRVKKVKKKGTCQATLKPEVAKLMDNFVEIKPNCKQKKKDRESSTVLPLPTPKKKNSVGRNENIEIDSAVPELAPSILPSKVSPQEPLQTEVLNQTVNAVQINFHKKEYKKKGIVKQSSKAKQPSITKSKKTKAAVNAEVKSLSEKTNEKCFSNSLKTNASSQTTFCEVSHITDEQYSADEHEFLPAITTTYTLKECAQNDTNETKDQKNITIIETCNIHQAKKMVAENIQVPSVPTKDVIRQKIAELKSNPNVSISWLPTLRIKCQDDGDFVCGRCNVICDDMEDYMDHIQDCLTMTSVTLEPTSNPPRRFLRLRNEISTLRYQEPNNNRYSVNQNLINKLQTVLPQAKEYLTVGSQSNKMYTSLTKSSRQSFKDLLDDDFGHESQEWINSPSSVSPVEGRRQHSGKVIPRNLQGVSHTPLNNIGMIQTKISVNNGKVSQPMVMIPVDHKSKPDTCLTLTKDQGRLEVLEKVEEAIGCTSTLSSHSFTPSSTAMIHSPLDMLLDPDEIKMEVEEEVVDDHFEVSQFAISYTCWV
ncbi:uncharacterized protein LOC119580187 [Penaeus monodon]|uniref:uncharacterized protein LOC119580187 n=1 Tax=Penaeus monodon TaxID=6687 RepID=UPI0018A7BCF4|nr:uncharacterized protein LOC119580187 [Penaeus monodon]